MVAWNLGALNGRTMLDLSRARRLAADRRPSRARGFASERSRRTRRVRASPRWFDATFRCLSESCATIGGVQIQNRGTIGGNLANASPAGDTFPPLAVYDARVNVRSRRPPRRCPFDAIFAGPKKTTLAPGRTDRGDRARATRASARPPGLSQGRHTRRPGDLEGRRGRRAVARTRRPRRGAALRARQRGADGAAAARGRGRGEGRAAGSTTRFRPRSRASSDDVSPIDDMRSTREYRLLVSPAPVRAVPARVNPRAQVG